MGRLFLFPVILLMVSLYSFRMDRVPRWLSVIGIITSIALAVWAWRAATAFYKMIGWLK